MYRPASTRIKQIGNGALEFPGQETRPRRQSVNETGMERRILQLFDSHKMRLYFVAPERVLI
jgi:hypothetical protein